MKRRATARCAAANDEEDLGSLFSEPPTVAVVGGVKRRKEEEESFMGCDGAMAAGGERPAPGAEKTKKEKEFAWMDSDDDEQEPEKAAEEADEDAREGGDEEDGEDARVTAQTLEEVQSFGRMILLAPALRRWLRSGDVASADIVAVCRAMARTKFFDGEILEDLYEVLRRLLPAGELDIPQANDAVRCFWALNAYERSVFSALAAAFRGQTALMEAGLRAEWLQIFRAFGHERDGDFLQLLDVPELPPTSPTFRKIRCWYFAKGSCAVGEACTFLHDMRAPLSLESAGDFLRMKPTVMTADQETLGKGTYGTFRGALPVAPATGLPPLLGAAQQLAQGHFFFSG